jgi:hypothetical protein
MRIDLIPQSWRCPEDHPENATCSLTFTPADVYTTDLNKILAQMKGSFLKIVGFGIPKVGQYFLTVFGHAQLAEHHRDLPEKPHFLLDLNVINGKVTCPKCHYDATLDSWAPNTDHTGCPQCGTSVIRLRLKEWGDRQ